MSTVSVNQPLASNVTISSFAFSFQYLAGYSPTSPNASNFSVLVAGQRVYVSP